MRKAYDVRVPDMYMKIEDSLPTILSIIIIVEYSLGLGEVSSMQAAAAGACKPHGKPCALVDGTLLHFHFTRKKWVSSSEYNIGTCDITTRRRCVKPLGPWT